MIDEVECYLDARYILSVEAAWHILEFGMHLEWLSVYCLPIHLPNHQMVVYDPTGNVQDFCSGLPHQPPVSLDGSEPMLILCLSQSELITIYIKIFQRALYGISNRRSGQHIKEGM